MIEAIRLLREPVTVILRSDSKTALAWAKLDSFKKQNARLKNPVVWLMVQEYRALALKHTILFEWVRGHNGDTDNERCDHLAEDQSRRPF